MIIHVMRKSIIARTYTVSYARDTHSAYTRIGII